MKKKPPYLSTVFMYYINRFIIKKFVGEGAYPLEYWKENGYFENNTIKVRRTSNYTAKKGIYTDTTITRKSQRTQKYPKYVMDTLVRFFEENIII